MTSRDSDSNSVGIVLKDTAHQSNLQYLHKNCIKKMCVRSLTSVSSKKTRLNWADCVQCVRLTSLWIRALCAALSYLHFYCTLTLYCTCYLQSARCKMQLLVFKLAWDSKSIYPGHDKNIWCGLGDREREELAHREKRLITGGALMDVKFCSTGIRDSSATLHKS